MRPLYILLLMLLSVPMLSQERYKVLDDKSGAPVCDAFVLSFSADSSVVETAITGREGYFSLQEEDYALVSIRNLEYQTLTLSRDSLHRITSHIIRLQRSLINLDELTVVADGATSTADLETILITDSLRMGVNSSAMLLGKLSGIRVDWVSEEVRVGKESGVPVLVDGLSVPKSYAMGLRPERVAKVEILRYPAGRYHDHPVVLNIVMRKDYHGIDVSSRVQLMSTTRKHNSSLRSYSADMLSTHERWNAYGSLLYRRKRVYDVSEYVKDYEGYYREASAPIDLAHPTLNRSLETAQLTLGADYKINPRHSLSIQGQADYSRQGKMETYSLAIKGSPGTSIEEVTQENRDHFKSLSSALMISYRYRVTDRLRLSTDLTYNRYDVREQYRYLRDQLTSHSSSLRGDKDYLRHYIDGSWDITDSWQVRIDNSLIRRRYSEQQTEGSPERFASLEIRDDLSMTAGYHPGRNFDVSSGARLLSVSTRSGEQVGRSLSLTPFLKLYWHPISLVDLRLQYFSSVDHPTLDQLSPLGWRIDSKMIRQGNPELKRRIMNYAELQIGLRGIIKLSGMYRFSKDDITPYYYKQPTGTDFVQSLTNSDFGHAYIGAEGDYELTKRLRLSLLLSHQWYRRTSPDLDRVGRGRSYTLDSKLVYSIPRAKASLMLLYYLRHDRLPLLQGRAYQQEETLALAANKLFLGDKLSLSVMLSLPARAIPKRTYTEISIPGYRSIHYGDDRLNQTSLSLNLRLSLGYGKVRRLTSGISLEKEKAD